MCEKVAKKSSFSSKSKKSEINYHGVYVSVCESGRLFVFGINTQTNKRYWVAKALVLCKLNWSEDKKEDKEILRKVRILFKYRI